MDKPYKEIAQRRLRESGGMWRQPLRHALLGKPASASGDRQQVELLHRWASLQ
jgi:hypothetical protein